MTTTPATNSDDGRVHEGLGTEYAYERIRAAIVEQRYPPGQRLVEQQIAAEFDMSRTPVREAIRRLEAEGLVVTERNRGAIVRQVTMADVLDLYELRSRLESYAAELAAERATDDDLAELTTAVDEFSSVCESFPDNEADLESIRAMSTANRRIHNAIVAASHHQRLRTMLDRTVDIPLVFQAFRTFDHDERRRSDLFHHLIAEAIRGRAPERASRLMCEHIHQGLDAVLSGLPDRE